MLEIKALNKTYANGVQALKNVSLTLPPGMFGLLGPNGAGKTTLMKILATLLGPDSGAITLNDIDLLKQPMAVRRLLGYLPQEFGFYPTFTAEQMLDYLARLKGVIDRRERKALIGALLEKVNLTSARKQKLGGFSGGMQQRLGIAQALIGQPKLIIVDEPTAGLDPEERIRFHNLFAEIAGDDTVVLLSTHIVADVANLCQRFAIIRQGEIVVSCSPNEALAQISGSVWETTTTRGNLAELRSRCQVISVQAVEGKLRVKVFSPDSPPRHGFESAAATLEDFYFARSDQRELES